jgi:hypothetical protein
MSYKYDYEYEDKKYVPAKLQTNRNMWKLMILSILTLGLYSFAFFIPLTFDLDKIAPKRYGEKTMNYIFAYLLAYFTFNIVIDIWHYQVAQRVEEALKERDIDYEFGTSDFWRWFFFGSLILVGPFVYFHKLCKAMNLLCQSYNKNTVIESK